MFSLVAIPVYGSRIFWQLTTFFYQPKQINYILFQKILSYINSINIKNPLFKRNVKEFRSLRETTVIFETMEDTNGNYDLFIYA